MTKDIWTVQVTATAEADFRTILSWTTENFGTAQARSYAATLTTAMAALVQGPKTVGAKRRSDIASGLFVLHVARAGRRGRHFVMFRVKTEKEQRVVQILRLLHDAMDLQRHSPGSENLP